jgi:hypothetical protein
LSGLAKSRDGCILIAFHEQEASCEHSRLYHRVILPG